MTDYTDQRTKVVQELMEIISISINAGRCPNMRFALVIWCDCGDGPIYTGGNEECHDRSVNMLRKSVALLEEVAAADGPVGHA